MAKRPQAPDAGAERGGFPVSRRIVDLYCIGGKKQQYKVQSRTKKLACRFIGGLYDSYYRFLVN
jgi:hypothetical protein